MRVDIKIFRQFDADLLMIREAGYSLPRLMRDAVSAFANGRNLKVHLDRADPNRFVLTDLKSYRFIAYFDDKDTKVKELLSHVEPRFKCAFCKTVLRNALVTENIYPFVDDKESVRKLLYEDETNVSIGRYVMRGNHAHMTKLRFYGDDADGISYTDDFTGEEKPADKKKEPEATESVGKAEDSVPDKSKEKAEIPEKPEKADKTDEPAVTETEEKPAVKHFDIPQIEPVVRPLAFKEEKKVPDTAEKNDTADATVQTDAPVSATSVSGITPAPADETALQKPVQPPIQQPPDDGSAPDEGIVYVDDSDDDDDLSEEALLDAFDKL